MTYQSLSPYTQTSSLCFVNVSMTARAALAETRCSRMTERSGRTTNPPLNAVIGSRR